MFLFYQTFFYFFFFAIAYFFTFFSVKPGHFIYVINAFLLYLTNTQSKKLKLKNEETEFGSIDSCFYFTKHFSKHRDINKAQKKPISFTM